MQASLRVSQICVKYVFMLSDAMTKPRPNEFKNFDGLPLLKVYLRGSLECIPPSDSQKAEKQQQAQVEDSLFVGTFIPLFERLDAL